MTRLSLLLSLGIAGCGASSTDPPSGPEPDGAEGEVEEEPTGEGEAEEEPDQEEEPDPEPAACFPLEGGGPDYLQYDPIIRNDCTGTAEQQIEGVERLVFLGDSITAGTPPTPSTLYYRNRLGDEMRTRFGDDLAIDDCSAWGAQTEDLLVSPGAQIPQCFDDVEPRRTLVVMTIGGNDMSDVAQASLAGASVEESVAEVDVALAQLRDAIEWLTDPAHFPNGSYVVFANVYEFTDGTGDLPSCPAAAFAGYHDPWPQGRDIFLHLSEGMMQIAVDTGTDMIFLLETFCGHGFHADDPDTECYRGEGTETWFDLTCIHPNPTGHGVIADLFESVIDG